MKKFFTTIGLFLIVAIPMLVAGPLFIPAIVRSHGVAVDDAHWCKPGLCFGKAAAGRIHAESAILGWDGVLRLDKVRIADPHSKNGAAAREAVDEEVTAAELPTLPGVRRVEVTDLVIEGTPLPMLSGEVMPERHLEGDGARVDGDVAALTLHTEFGDVEVTAEPADPGQHVVASCRCTFSNASLGGVLADRQVRAEGMLEHGEFTGDVTVQGVSAHMVGRVGGATKLSGHFTVADTPIAIVYGVFEPIVPELEKAEIHGTFSAKGRFTLEPFSLHVEPEVNGFVVDGLVSPAYKQGNFTWIGHDAQGGPSTEHGGDDSPDWLPLPAMGDMLPMAVMAAEDSAFLRHPGYDLKGMIDAQNDNAKAGDVVRGGSTLTQQLAKNLFLSGDRTYARKLRELLYAVEMERELGKPRILELYLNVVEWGPGIHGGKDAAEAYFLKAPKGLLPEEAAFLASILRSPRKAWAKEYVGGRVNGHRLSAILDNMVGLDPVMHDEALARDVHFVPPE